LAATGSGKTGAFFIPIVNQLQRFRRSPRNEGKNIDAPLVIVVAHTKELVGQLFKVVRMFARGLFLLETGKKILM
jgi:superfamily II DNA/RNA helicase